MSAPLPGSGDRPAPDAGDGAPGARGAVEAAAGRTRARALIVAATGLACLFAYASGPLPVHVGSEPPRVAGTSPPNPDRPGGAGSSRAATQPVAERSGGVERGSLSGRLGEALAFLAGDGAGLVARDLALLGVPDGAAFRRLGLAAALLGALTVAGLVGVMLGVGIAPVAAVASALVFASSYPALHGALTLDAAMARAPMLVGALCLLLAGTGRRLSRGLRVAGAGVWLLCAFAEPAALCVLPGMVLFLYLAESGRPTCGPLAMWAAIAGGLLFGTLLAASGITAAGVAAAHANPPRVIRLELGALGLAFLAAGALRLGGRPTRGELLLWTSGSAAAAWMLGAESVDTRGLATVLLLIVPLVGYGMSAALRSRPGRRHAWAVGVLSLLLPASGLPGAVPQLAELREDRARRLAPADTLAAALPQGAAVATAANVEEPIAAAWRFTGIDGPPVVDAPLDVRRMRELQAELPVIVAFEPTRLRLEVLGFRLRALGFRGSGLPGMARLRRWEGCTAVRGGAWEDVTNIVESRYVGVGFGERPGHAVLALYLTADGGPLDVEPGVSRHLRADVVVDAFDRREPGDAGRLRRRLLQDGLAARRLGGRESVQRVRMSRARGEQPLAALRIGGVRPGRALARVVEAAGDEPVFLCRASRRATVRRYGRRGGRPGRPRGRGHHRLDPAATDGPAGPAGSR